MSRQVADMLCHPVWSRGTVESNMSMGKNAKIVSTALISEREHCAGGFHRHETMIGRRSPFC